MNLPGDEDRRLRLAQPRLQRFVDRAVGQRRPDGLGGERPGRDGGRAAQELAAGS